MVSEDSGGCLALGLQQPHNGLIIFYQNVNVLFAAVFPEPLLADLDLRCVGICSFCIVRAEARSQRQSTAYAVLLLRGALRFLVLVTSRSDVRTFI